VYLPTFRKTIRKTKRNESITTIDDAMIATNFVALYFVLATLVA